MGLKLSELQTHEEVLEEELADPEFRAEWERLALARAVANYLVRYRAEHGLSQRQLAELLQVKQPQVSRLEAATHNPNFETLSLLADRLGWEILVDISPSEGRRRWLRSRPRAAEMFEADALSNGARVAIAARQRARPSVLRGKRPRLSARAKPGTRQALAEA